MKVILQCVICSRCERLLFEDFGGLAHHDEHVDPGDRGAAESTVFRPSSRAASGLRKWSESTSMAIVLPGFSANELAY